MVKLPTKERRKELWRRLVTFLSEDWELKLLVVLAVLGLAVTAIPYITVELGNIAAYYTLAVVCTLALHEIRASRAIKTDLSAVSSLQKVHDTKLDQVIKEQSRSREHVAGLSTIQEEQDTKLDRVVKSQRQTLERFLVPSGAQAVDQREFYRRLSEATRTAERQIELTHHEAMPPSLTGIQEKREYFTTIEHTLLHTDLPVRRIVSIPTPAKLEWVEDYLLGTFAERPNFSLRYTPFSYADRPTLIPLSLQIFDREACAVINVHSGSHTETEPDLDLWIDSDVVAQYFSRYYDQYWAVCLPLKEGNNIYEVNLKDIRKRLGASNEATT